MDSFSAPPILVATGDTAHLVKEKNMTKSIPMVLAALSLAASMSLAPGARAQEAEELVVYNAQHEALGNAWIEAFTKETGIKVVVRKGSDMQLANLILEEGDLSPADVFLTENSPAMVLLDEAGRFVPVEKETLDQVPAEYRPADGMWTGIAARSTVFAYDRTKLTEDKLPKSLLDLADPAWKGRWGASPAGADFQAIMGALLQLKGEETTASWLGAMKENATPYKGNSIAMKAVNAGEIEGAVIYHYYWFGDQAKTGENSGNVALHYFRNQDPGAFVSISGGGVLKSGKHQKEAQAFLKWIAGKGGQSILRDGDSYEYAVAGESNPKLVPLKDLDAPKVEASTLDNKKVVELMTAAGLL